VLEQRLVNGSEGFGRYVSAQTHAAHLGANAAGAGNEVELGLDISHGSCLVEKWG